MKYPVISLFSGAMGLDLGLMQAGLQVSLSQDIDPWVGKTMEANRHPHILGDIAQLIQEDPSCQFLLDKSNLKKEDLFAVVGGPPCQPFSTAGKRLGISDPRGTLFNEFATVVKSLRPRFFVMENVKGLTSMDVKPDKSVLDVILDTFHGMGYKTVHSVLDAVHYGVPQFRERLIIIGSRDHEDIYLPRPTHFQTHQNAAYRWQTIRSVISDLEKNPGIYSNFSDDRLAFLKKIPMGGNWRNLSVADQKVAMGGAFTSGGGKTGMYRRLHYDQPSPTLVTSPLQKSTMLCHPAEDRPLSTKEYARIQQFPDDWIIEGKATHLYRQIGNAVPVGLARAIGETLLSVANNESTIISKRYR